MTNTNAATITAATTTAALAEYVAGAIRSGEIYSYRGSSKKPRVIRAERERTSLLARPYIFATRMGDEVVLQTRELFEASAKGKLEEHQGGLLKATGTASVWAVPASALDETTARAAILAEYPVQVEEIKAEIWELEQQEKAAEDEASVYETQAEELREQLEALEAKERNAQSRAAHLYLQRRTQQRTGDILAYALAQHPDFKPAAQVEDEPEAEAETIEIAA